jgi:hypothetical protein
MEIMLSVFTSLPSFSINEVVSTIENELEKLKKFSEKDFPFQVQDKINSVLALIDDCSKKSRICYNFYDELTILETYSENGDKKRVRLILDKYGSIENLLKESSSELKDFRKKLHLCKDYLKRIDHEIIRRYDLVCDKCEGKGNLHKTMYVRERGSSPQPYTESIVCDRCQGKGRIILDSELKRKLLDFIQRLKPIQMKLKIYIITLENYLKNYKIPTLQGINEIELIFPEDDPKSKKTQQPISEFIKNSN